MTDAQDLIDRAEALLVDLDGTLVDSTGPVTRAWTAFAARHGLDPATVMAYAHGRPSRETVAHFADPADQEAEAALVLRTEIGDPDGVLALPGAHAVLTCGRPLALVTSCSRALAEVRLRAAGLPLPTTTVTSDDVHRGKPDPECFLLGARRLDVPPASCLVLEDAPAGIAAGRAAGARVLAVRTTHEDVTGDAVVASLDGLRW